MMNNIKKEKWIIVILVLVGMFLVYPASIIRNEAECASGGEVAYGSTEGLLSNAESIQIFTAQYKYLRQLSLAFSLDDNSEKAGVIQIYLKDEAGEVVKQAEIPIEELTDYCYYDIPMDIRLKEGMQYQISMQILDCPTNIPGICYTTEESQHTAGNVSLLVNGQLVDGQAVTRYIYETRISFSNILCLWFFLICIGFAVTEWIERIRGNQQREAIENVC